jgi:parallel beta-helix repeat protein
MDMQFYVSVNGNDAWTGLQAEQAPGRMDGPFASLQRARDAARAARKDKPDEPCQVTVRQGKYYLEETLVLTPEDGGSAAAPVIYQAFPGEQVVLSGGRKIEGWQPFRGHILAAVCPEIVGRRDKNRQLFHNGHVQTRARWPKNDPADPLYTGFLFAEGPGEKDSHHSFIYKEGSFRKEWAKINQVDVNIYQWNGCYQVVVPIKSIDRDLRIVNLAHDGYNVTNIPPWSWPCPFMKGDRYFIENALEELDQPGEWCADYDEGIIYFWPAQELSAADEVVLPHLDCLIELQGASFVTIKGFTLAETTGGDAWHRTGLEGYGAQLPLPGWTYCGEAVLLEGTRHCLIEDCLFHYVGGNAIYLAHANERNVIRHNEIAFAGANGICLLGTKSGHPVFNLIEDNEIHHSGCQNKYTAGIFLGISDGTIMEHNHIHHVPHHAINLASNGYGRNHVQYNRIEFACLELHDNGAINMWMDELDERGYVIRNAERAGHIIRNNYIGDVIGCRIREDGTRDEGTLTWGIYLDDFSSNCVIQDNIIVRAGSGICIHGGKNNLIENNMILNTQFGLRPTNYCVFRTSTEKTMQNFNTGNVFCRNIVSNISNKTSESDVISLHYYTDRLFARIDNNLYYNAAGRYTVQECPGTYYKIFDYPFIEWQQKGNDTHSLTGDPLIIDLEREDFSLAEDSPACQIGFHPIDTSCIGRLKG